MKRPFLVIAGIAAGLLLVAGAGASAHTALNVMGLGTTSGSALRDEASSSRGESPEPSPTIIEESPEASPSAEASPKAEPSEAPESEAPDNDNEQGDNDNQGEDGNNSGDSGDSGD
jgi:hypothetical protein